MVNKKAICYALLLGLICVSEVEAVRGKKGDKSDSDAALHTANQQVSQDPLVGTQFQSLLGVPPTFTGQPSGTMEHQVLQRLTSANPAHLEHIEPGDEDKLATSTDAKKPVSPEPQSSGQAEVDREEVVPGNGHSHGNGSVANDGHGQAEMFDFEGLSDAERQTVPGATSAKDAQAEVTDEKFSLAAETQVSRDEESNGGIAGETEKSSEVDYSDMPALEPIPGALPNEFDGSIAPTEPVVFTNSEADSKTPVFGGAEDTGLSHSTGQADVSANQVGTPANGAEHAEQSGQTSIRSELPKDPEHVSISLPPSFARQESRVAHFGDTKNTISRQEFAVHMPAFEKLNRSASAPALPTSQLDYESTPSAKSDPEQFLDYRTWEDRQSALSGAFPSDFMHLPSVGTWMIPRSPHYLKSSDCNWLVRLPNGTEEYRKDLLGLPPGSVGIQWRQFTDIVGGNTMTNGEFFVIDETCTPVTGTFFCPTTFNPLGHLNYFVSLLSSAKTNHKKSGFIPLSNSNTEVAIATKTSFPTLLGNLKKPLSEVTSLSGSENKSGKQSGGDKRNTINTDWEGVFSFANVGDNQENTIPEATKNKLSGEELQNQTPINA